jgi:hypothetical protein
MRLAGQVVHIDWMRNAYNILVGKLEGRYHSEYLRVDGRILLKWI